MTQTETTPISGLTLDSLFRENSDSISSEDDEPPLMSPDATGTTAKTDGAIHEWVAKNVVDTTSQPPVLRKTPIGSPATTPEHSPATQLRLGKWVDGLKDNAKVKLGESAYKVSPFSQARLSI